MSVKQLFRKKSVQSILKEVENSNHEKSEGVLKKHLGVRDLTALGIAAIIGAGIFSTIGRASSEGGPSIIFLFIFTAIACSFAAFAYAEFASMVPVAGSAYTYSYVAFGEIIAWIIGWSLIMEYGIGNITVAISWSDYFTGLLASGGIHLPQWVQMDYLSAFNGFETAKGLLQEGQIVENLQPEIQNAYFAWKQSPQFGNVHFIADLPALIIIILITTLVYRGIKETKNASNLMVIIKLSVILLIIAVGVFYVDTENWTPFSPNGVNGVLKGVSAVFFAYIGFDAISTTAEECKDPQRDIPRGMMWAIIICTILYILIALVLTGMVNYTNLNVGDPLAFAFDQVGLKWMSGVVAVSALIAMAGVLLVFQLGQPRIWMSMSRDGLLPKSFSKIHPKYNTPSFSTIVTGMVVAIPALFMNLNVVTDLCSIGTLFAFVVVCAGVLVLQNKPDVPKGKFTTPYINSKYILPILLIFSVVYSFTSNKENTMAFIQNQKIVNEPASIINRLNEKEKLEVQNYLTLNDRDKYQQHQKNLLSYFNAIPKEEYLQQLSSLPLKEEIKFTSGFALFKYKIPMWIFIVITLILTFLAYTKSLSLIPVLGLLSCLYMMAELGLNNWIGFSIWLIVGIIIYLAYGRKRSKLNTIQLQD